MSIKINKEDTIKKFQEHDRDSGSMEVQIALFSDSIRRLTKHLQENPKDFSTKRGLLGLVGKRKRYLTHLRKVSADRYKNIISQLGLRR